MKKLLSTTRLAAGMFGGRTVRAMYLSGRLVWEAIRSCFGSGVWYNEKPWLNKEEWKNKK